MNKLKRTKNNDLKTSDENIKLENHKSKAMSKVMAVLQKFGRAVISYLVFTASQTIFIHQPDGEFHDVMWFHNQAGVKNLVSQNLGITSLSTGLFGAIIVAVIVVVVYNKFKYIQLPQAISFFSGIRFLPFILIPASFGLAVVFTVFWPWIGGLVDLEKKSHKHQLELMV
jgi:phosphotransferase system  glucose/maltose/N-acetylglucosamine-specific IIC component